MSVGLPAWPELRTLPVISKLCAERSRTSAWRLDESRFWVNAFHAASRRPQQGWKLHVAAGVLSAGDVLDRALPVLLDEDADFKVVPSLQQLAVLNDGRGGLTQVGKFITVYPNDDEQAVRLATALDRATEHLSGPRIASDRALRPHSLVHYRYGGFGDLQVQTKRGEVLPALEAPDGSLVPDRRTSSSPPSWITDPFAAAGLLEEGPPQSRMIGQRYVILAVLHDSPRSQVLLCLDLSVPVRCAVKRVWNDGNGGLDRLRQEFAMLTRLAPHPRFPQPLELIADGDSLCLAMEDVDGRTLDRHVMDLRERQAVPSVADVVRWTEELASMLEAIHAEGLVHGDLKSSNVLVTPDGGLRLVDFELTRPIGDTGGDAALPGGRGSRGYMSPQQSAGEPPTVADDVYGLGAVLYLVATGAEPSFAPDPAALPGRPVEALNPAVPPALATAIGRCLDPIPSRRPGSAAEVAKVVAEAIASGARRPAKRPPASETDVNRRALRLARSIGDVLARRIDTRDDPRDWDGWTLDLNMGLAGAVLVLAELVAEFGDPAHRAALERGARWLADAPRPGGPRLPGLYVGESGVGAAQLRAGQVLGDERLVGAAADTGRWVASVPHDSPDLFNGTAGRLRLHLWLWQQTAEPQHLEHAGAAGEHLLSVAEHEADMARWEIPAGYPGLSGRRLTGYAHGAAGIADVALDLYEITGQTPLLDAALGVCRWLSRTAHAGPEAGMNWPPDEGGRATMAFWCHGGAGIARFLLHLWQLTGDAEALEQARAAAPAVGRGTRWAGVTQCHGLSGNVECLLDLHQATGDEEHLANARSLAPLVQAFAVRRDGQLTIVTDVERSDPGFSVGSAGVAACLLRLADPHVRPHLLSLRGFARRERASVLA